MIVIELKTRNIKSPNGKLSNLGFKYVVKFFVEMGLKLSKQNFGKGTHPLCNNNKFWQTKER